MISIIIPVYNVACYLPDMLDSIISQSYTEFEIILVNDGSTDDSSAVCHKYAENHDRIRVYDRENHGASAARNFGAEMAIGDFLWFMDSDDRLEKDALLCAVEAQKKCDADVVIGGMNFCFRDEGRIVPKQIPKDVVFSSCEFKQLYEGLFSLNYISPLWNKLIRRSVIVNNNIQMNEALHMYEDYVFCMDILLECKTIACLSKIFYNYELRNTRSLSRRYKDNAIEMFYFLENKISGYIYRFGNDASSANISLNNLLIYLAYECVKNEARHKHSYTKVRKILHDKNFHRAVNAYNGTGKRYKVVRQLMKRKMSFLLLMYLRINKKI